MGEVNQGAQWIFLFWFCFGHTRNRVVGIQTLILVFKPKPISYVWKWLRSCIFYLFFSLQIPLSSAKISFGTKYCGRAEERKRHNSIASFFAIYSYIKSQ